MNEIRAKSEFRGDVPLEQPLSSRPFVRRRRRHAHVYLIVLCAAALAASALMLGVTGSVAAKRHHHCGRVWRSPRKATNHQLRTSTLCLVNRARKRHGIARLHFDVRLRRSATSLSRAMVGHGIFSHYGPNGSTPLSRIARAGYFGHASSYRLAENIATGRGRSQVSPAAVVRAWMHSPEHRANILDRSMRDFGVGVVRGDPFGGRRRNAVTYTLDFGTRGRR